MKLADIEESKDVMIDTTTAAAVKTGGAGDKQQTEIINELDKIKGTPEMQNEMEKLNQAQAE
jgi:hypothetical protein